MKHLNPLVLTFLAIIAFSCDDSESDVVSDTTGPEITIEKLKENQRVHGLMRIEANVQDQSSVTSMKAFVDEIMVKESSTREISFDVDTKTLSDGNHAIRIAAIDKNGNSSEKSIAFEVVNTLITIQVSSNYVPQFTEIYFGLSRNDGTLIAVEQVENGELISVPTPPDFNPDSTFVLTEYFYLHQPVVGDGEIEYVIRTRNFWAGLNAGNFRLIEYDDSPITGAHQLDVSEVPTTHYVNISGSNLASTALYFGDSGSISHEILMKNNSSDLYFTLQEGDAIPVYKYISNINSGEYTQFSCEGLPQLQKGLVTTRDNAGSFNCQVTAPSGYYIYSANASFEGGAIPVYYPSGILPEYMFYLVYSLGSNGYVNRIKAATPPTSFQYLDGYVDNINYYGGQLDVSTTGSFDMVDISGGSSNFENQVFSMDNYYVHFPFGSKHKISIPETPALLAGYGFSSEGAFQFTSSAFSDYLDVAGKSDYQNKIVFSADNLQLQSRESVMQISAIEPTYTGGRLSSKEKITFPVHLRSVLKNRISAGLE